MFSKKRVIDGYFSQLQDVTGDDGRFLNTVLFSKNGDCSVIIEIENPVQQYSTDAELYMDFMDVLNCRHWAKGMPSRSRTSSASSSTTMR